MDSSKHPKKDHIQFQQAHQVGIFLPLAAINLVVSFVNDGNVCLDPGFGLLEMSHGVVCLTVIKCAVSRQNTHLL